MRQNIDIISRINNLSWEWTIKSVYIKDLNIYGPIFGFSVLANVSVLLIEREKRDGERIFHDSQSPPALLSYYPPDLIMLLQRLLQLYS